MINERTNLYYDPQRDWYDTTVWKTISWTPSLVSNKIRLSNSSIIWYDSIMSGDLIMALTIPTAPTGWDSRLFGFYQLTNWSFIGFNITDAVFKAQIVDSSWTSTLSNEITWNNDWTAVVTKFRVHWTGFDAKFYIWDTQVAAISDIEKIKYPLSIYINNVNADNLDLSSIQLKWTDIFLSNKVNVGNLISTPYDYVSLGYTGNDATTITYKSWGASGKTVGTLILTYDGSHNVTSITKS